MAIIERIVTVYNDKGSKKALNDLKKLESTFIDASKKIAKAFGAATLAAGALATKLAVDGVQAAVADQKSQALLANALRNTTGASDAAIASVEDYISAQQRSVAVTDDELRPSLATLLNATRDVTEAQALQNLALDISAGTQKDLQTVSLALAKAVGGNMGALTKLGVPLSENVKKSKDLNAAFKELGKTFAGAASTRAQTFEGRMTALRISFDETLETLGYALIPVLEDLARTFQTEILPVFEEFIAKNKDEIANSLRDVIKFGIQAAKALGSMFKTISNNLTTFKVFAGILTGIFIGTKVYAGIIAITGALKLLTLQFRRQAVAGTAAGTATAFATGGTSALAAAAGLTAFAAAAGVTWLAINKLTGAVEVNGKTTEKYSQVVSNHLKDLQGIAQAVALAQGTGATTFDTKGTQDAINAEAARLNLIREGKIEQAAVIAARQAEREAIKLTIAEAQKYQDILQVLSDTQITTEEISILALKWGISTEAVKNYLVQYFAVADKKITSDEITVLANAWGLSTEQVAKYLDFINALKDGKLTSEEITALQEKWGMTVGEIQKYADFVIKVRDFKITDEEIKALGAAWGLTNTEVLAYLANIGIPFDYNGKFIDPVKGIETAWKDTTGAVDAYIKAVGNADTALGFLAKSSKSNAETVKTALDGATASAEALAIASQGALAIASEANAVAELARATAALADAEAMAAQAAADAAKAAAEAAAAAVSAIPKGFSSPVSPTSFGANTVTGGVARGEYESGIFGRGAGQSVTVNVNNAGSVITQDDLVTTIRDGLLTGIGSGLATTYNPRNIPG